MKTEPTDIDRAAAQIFMPQHGMVIMHSVEPGWQSDRIDDALMEEFGGDLLPAGNAIDTDDPGTIGVMYAQVLCMDGVVGLLMGVRRLADWSEIEGPAATVTLVTSGVGATWVTLDGRTVGQCLLAAMVHLEESRPAGFLQ